MKTDPHAASIVHEPPEETTTAGIDENHVEMLVAILEGVHESNWAVAESLQAIRKETQRLTEVITSDMAARRKLSSSEPAKQAPSGEFDFGEPADSR